MPRGRDRHRLPGCSQVVPGPLGPARRAGPGAADRRAGHRAALAAAVLVAQGRTSRPLASAVPTVAGPASDGLPRAYDAGTVAALLASTDTSTPAGRRHCAVLAVLSRLGLRVSEVAELQLDDIDWHHGELEVRGKAPNRRLRVCSVVSAGQRAGSDSWAGWAGAVPGECTEKFFRLRDPVGGSGTGLGSLARVDAGLGGRTRAMIGIDGDDRLAG